MSEPYIKHPLCTERLALLIYCVLSLQVKYQQKHPKICPLAALSGSRLAQIMPSHSSLTLQSPSAALWNTPLQQCPMNFTSTETQKQILLVSGLSILKVSKFPKWDQAIHTVDIWVPLLGLLVASLNAMFESDLLLFMSPSNRSIENKWINRATPSGSPEKPLESIYVCVEFSVGNPGTQISS